MPVSIIQLALCLGVAPLLLAATPENDAPDYKWQKRLRVIAAALDEASAALTRGDKAEALRLTELAYFEIFENPNRDEDMEVAIRMEFGRTRMYEIESQFRDLWRGLRAEQDVPPTEFRRQIAALLNELRAIAIELDGGDFRRQIAELLDEILSIASESDNSAPPPNPRRQIAVLLDEMRGIALELNGDVTPTDSGRLVAALLDKLRNITSKLESGILPTDSRSQIVALLNRVHRIAIELDGGAVMPTEKKAEPAVAADIPRPDMTRALLEIALIGAGIVAVAAFLYWRLKHPKSTHRS
jgi:hypothetical protein